MSNIKPGGLVRLMLCQGAVTIRLSTLTKVATAKKEMGGKVIRVLVILLTKARRLWRCDVVGICHTVARVWLLCNCTAFLSPVAHPRWIPSCQDSWSPVGCHPPKTCLALPTSMFACGKKPWTFSWLTCLQAIWENMVLCYVEIYSQHIHVEQ